MTAELKSTNTAEGGITLGAKNLYELIANAPGEDVTLKRPPETIHSDATWMTRVVRRRSLV